MSVLPLHAIIYILARQKTKQHLAPRLTVRHGSRLLQNDTNTESTHKDIEIPEYVVEGENSESKAE